MRSTYDGAGRLKTEAESTGYGASYQYNAFGNRTTMTVTGADAYTTTYDYDANNRLRTESKAVSTSTLVTNYYYDPNGNQLSKVSEALVAAGSGTPSLSLGRTGAELYKYDGFNRLTEANIGGDVVSYDYRADGLRNSKTSNTGTVTHLWDGGSIVADVPSAGTTEVYLRGVGLIMATGSSTAYYLYNGHGDVVQLTGTNGAVTKSYDYDAFGVERAPVSSDVNPWRFCGEYFDAETGTVYLRARYYSPGTGRFSAEDPARAGLNWYTYCLNNPVNRVDFWGLDSWVIFEPGVIAGDGEHTFDDEAKIREKQLSKKHGTPVHLLEVSNANDFNEKWNSELGFVNGKAVNIDEVVIILHGSVKGDTHIDRESGKLFFNDGSSIWARAPYIDVGLDGYFSLKEKGDILVSDLGSKKIGELYFSSCNTANPDVYNIVYAFMQIVDYSQITGWDGGTIYNYGTNQLERGPYDPNNLLQIIRRQATFYKYAEKGWNLYPTRTTMGERVFSK